MLCTHKTTILCQFGLFFVTSLLTHISINSQPFLVGIVSLVNRSGSSGNEVDLNLDQLAQIKNQMKERQWDGPVYLPKSIYVLMNEESKEALKKYNLEPLQYFKNRKVS